MPTLPPGVQGPYFNDEFGDVFGIIYAFTGDGFTLPQLRHVVEDVREDLLPVPGVGKIGLVGDQEERLFIDFSHRKLAELGLSVPDVMAVASNEYAIAAGGFVDTAHDRVYVRPGTRWTGWRRCGRSRSRRAAIGCDWATLRRSAAARSIRQRRRCG